MASDELRLRLPGIAQCMGSSRDTRPFVEVLRWLAEKEAAYEPQPGNEADMPRITSAGIAEYLLGLTDSDQFALKRLYECSAWITRVSAGSVPMKMAGT